MQLLSGHKATRAALPLAFLFLGGALGLANCAGASSSPGGSPAALAVPVGLWAVDPTLVDEVVPLTQALVRARPENPPGKTRAALEVVAARLRAAGIEPELKAYGEDGHANLWAVLPGRNRALPPLVLMGHSDVVPADAADWSSPPFEAARVGEHLVGRGVIDMLGMVALQTLTLVALKTSAVPLERDVVLLVEGDEEVAGLGAQAALRDWPALRGAWAVLTEGGFLLESYLRPGEDLAAITVAEKGILQVTLSARGPAGHGSVPLQDAAPDRVLRAAQRVLDREVPRRVTAPVEAQLHALGAQRGGIEGFVLTTPPLSTLVGQSVLEATAQSRALLRDTCALTLMSAGVKRNVIPSTASASFDCRLLPGTTPEGFRDRLLVLVDDPRVDLSVALSRAPSASNPDHPLVRALGARLKAEMPALVVLPILTRGSTDCSFLREAGVPCYGLIPVRLSDQELDAMHGTDERVRVVELEKGLSRLVDVSAALAASAAN